MAADRDLLFGLLALQNGLIDQVQLVAAFQAWTRAKTRPLAEHLVARGDLDVEQRAGVEAMVVLHLKKHGGDAQRSLAAIAAGLSTRERLARGGDGDIGASLARLGPESTLVGDDAERTTSFAVGTRTSDGQRFHILRPHAQGGLGAVFVALDNELHREVALKQIRERHADDPASRQRFLLEAEITGGLEHPGIVPVYGLGTYGDGRPYYAMRLIRGESLKEVIDRFHATSMRHGDQTEVYPGSSHTRPAGRVQPPGASNDPGRRSLELRKLLRRFVDVCNPIDYAHSRGVLHRDIKPGNVIVGQYGETLVVDWGMAKAVGRAEPGAAPGERTLIPASSGSVVETVPGSALGTPAYMSPEQALGDHDQLGPRSDVYSLGATLYCLLTGKPPFAGEEAGVILRQVQRGEFSPPRSIDPSIDGALEAVCLKAMALRPDDRYPTPRALAEDVDRWMADEPVTAWRDPLPRRARRWARRNRTAVATAAAAVLVALAGSATVLAVQTRAKWDLIAANALTRHERDLARQNFDLARAAVDDYLTRVGQNPLLKEQGLHGLRQELLEAALGYYRDFLRQRGDDPSVRSEAAAAHERVGNILIDLGRAGDAVAAYDQAVALFDPLVRSHPADPTMATAQVRLRAGRLHALSDGGWYPEAIIAFEGMKGVGEALLARGGGTQELPQILAGMYESAAFALKSVGRTDDALEASLKAHSLAEQATRDRPGDPSAVRALLWASEHATYLLRTRGRIDEARRLSEQVIALGRARVVEHPRDVELRMYLAFLEVNLGFILKNSSRPAQALELFNRATDSLGALTRENPLLIRARSFRAIALNDLSSLQTDVGRYAEAERSARTSIELFESLARDVSSTSFYRIKVGWAYASLGKAQLKAGFLGEALTSLRKATTIMETSQEAVDIYNLACALALEGTIADATDGPAAADRQRRAAERAVDAIRQAIAKGFADTDALKNDPDFNSLRSRPDFQALLMDVAFPANAFEQ
jgi:serine/threonine-protein kinase